MGWAVLIVLILGLIGGAVLFFKSPATAGLLGRKIENIEARWAGKTELREVTLAGQVNKIEQRGNNREELSAQRSDNRNCAKITTEYRQALDIISRGGGGGIFRTQKEKARRVTGAREVVKAYASSKCGT